MKILTTISFFIVVTLMISCDSKNKENEQKSKKITKPEITINLTNKGFSGKYIGAEFDSKGDVAHQFSNQVADIIGKQLKKSYEKGEFLKVDFKNTKITTSGLDLKDKVEFLIEMPFLKVSKCDAYTGIEHCGTWVNQNDEKLDARLNEKLQKLTTLSVGNIDKAYFHTDQGYKEYWIQFKHKDYQSDCK